MTFALLHNCADLSWLRQEMRLDGAAGSLHLAVSCQDAYPGNLRASILANSATGAAAGRRWYRCVPGVARVRAKTPPRQPGAVLDRGRSGRRRTDMQTVSATSKTAIETRVDATVLKPKGAR